MKIHYLQHVPFEGPGVIAHWAQARGHELTATRAFAGDIYPDPEGFDRLVVLGGPMSVHDEAEHPWLKEEKALIRHTLQTGKPLLGICLGAQLLAEALRARVYKAREKEIGWFPIQMRSEAVRSSLACDLPESLTVFHWHGETFDLPAGATHLAQSEGCANQAFEHAGLALGLQFHLEATPDGVRSLVEQCGDELTAGRFIQSTTDILTTNDHFLILESLTFKLLDRLFGGLAGNQS